MSNSPRKSAQIRGKRNAHKAPAMSTASAAVRRLAALADPVSATFAQRYFKTGKGQYGEGDRFRGGLNAAGMRQFARECEGMSLGETLKLLNSPYHEDRLIALLIMVRAYTRGDETTRRRIFDAYLANTKYINNWDLVDVSAPYIVGQHLENGTRTLLAKLARSDSLWERRIAMVATQHFIRRGDPKDALRIAAMLLQD